MLVLKAVNILGGSYSIVLVCIPIEYWSFLVKKLLPKLFRLEGNIMPLSRRGAIFVGL